MERLFFSEYDEYNYFTIVSEVPIFRFITPYRIIVAHCGDATAQRDVDDYYCIEDLVKQLVFDAKLTTPYFRDWHATKEVTRMIS